MLSAAGLGPVLPRLVRVVLRTVDSRPVTRFEIAAADKPTLLVSSDLVSPDSPASISACSTARSLRSRTESCPPPGSPKRDAPIVDQPTSVNGVKFRTD